MNTKPVFPLFVTACCLLLVRLSPAQTAMADNKISQTITFRSIPKGPAVVGVFQGRPPCQGLTQQLGLQTDADCIKFKCSLTLYRDPATQQPTTYSLAIVGGGDVVKQAGGGSYREKTLEGKWSVAKGISSHPDAVVYRLEGGKPGADLYLLKGDDNVLFILDEKKAFRIGNKDFSYTLNRVELVAGSR